jgi:hypothetical protein
MKNCWGVFHKWRNWKDDKIIDIYNGDFARRPSDAPMFMEMRQLKYCEKCGKCKTRRVRI